MEIEVIDTPFTDALYKSYMKSKDFRFTHIARRKGDNDITKGHALYQNALYHYRSFLACIGREDHYNPPEVWDETNKWLNILHRCFTRGWKGTYFGKPYRYELKNEECQHHLLQLNANIHECEYYVENDRMKTHDCSWFEVEGLNDESTLINLESIEYEISNDYDVTVMPYTLGKNFKIAYLDNDIVAEDVNNVDKKTYFSLKIDYDRRIRNMFESDDFAAWKKENKYDGPVGGIPIGNITRWPRPMRSRAIYMKGNAIDVGWVFD